MSLREQASGRITATSGGKGRRPNGGLMEYRLLGSSGCAVSALALGTLTFGNETDQAT